MYAFVYNHKNVAGAPCDRVRWRKDHVLYRPNAEVADKPKTEHENDCQIEGNLATEVSFIVLDTLEQIVQVMERFKFGK